MSSAEIAEEIEDVHEAAGWLRAMLSVLHEEPYIAIEPASRTGVVGQMSGIVENFQLNTLLMDEFPRDEPRVSKAAVEVARGSGPQQIDEDVTGVWNLFTFGALDGPRRRCPTRPMSPTATPGSGTRACRRTSPCSTDTA